MLTQGPCSVRTPAEDVVPAQLLLAHKHGHDDERVQVDPLAQHPEVIGAWGVVHETRQDLTADLRLKTQDQRVPIVFSLNVSTVLWGASS